MRTVRASGLTKHINKRHEEEKEWLLSKRCKECKFSFYKSYQYQRHYIGCHDTRTDEEVQATIEDMEIKAKIKSKSLRKEDLPTVTFCD